MADGTTGRDDEQTTPIPDDSVTDPITPVEPEIEAATDPEPPIPAATVTEPAPSSDEATAPLDEPTAPTQVVESPVVAAGAQAASGNVSAVRRVWQNRNSSWFWPLIGLVAYLLVLLVNFLANWLPFRDHMTDEVAREHPTAFQPASWSWFIGLLIYVLIGLYVVYTLTPGGQRSQRVRRIGPIFVLSSLANIAWIVLWHWENFLPALIAITVLWVALVVIYILASKGGTEGAPPSTWQKFAIQVPFSVYLGWASTMVLANFAVWASRDWTSGNPFSDRTWAIVLLLISVVVAGAFALFARDAIVPLVFVWADIAIAQEQWDRSTLVVVVAVIAAIASAALTVAAWSLRFNPDGLASLSPRRRRANVGGIDDGSGPAPSV